MKNQKSMKGLLIYLLIGIVAMIFFYLLNLSMLTSDPKQLEEIIDVFGVSGSTELLAFLGTIPNFIPLLIALLIGYFTAHKVGLTSLIIHPNARPNSKSEWMNGFKLAIVLGVIVGLIIGGIDLIFQPLIPESFIEATQLNDRYTPLYFMSALLYGGVVEELIMRFGFMSFVIFILWKLFNRKSEKPSDWIYILVITISALLFALLHYAPTAMATEMTPYMWIRMMVLNGLPGLIYSWLYWKRNLESAIVAHMFTHIAVAILLLISSIFM